MMTVTTGATPVVRAMDTMTIDRLTRAAGVGTAPVAGEHDRTQAQTPTSGILMMMRSGQER